MSELIARPPNPPLFGGGDAQSERLGKAQRIVLVALPRIEGAGALVVGEHVEADQAEALSCVAQSSAACIRRAATPWPSAASVTASTVT